VCEIEAWEHGFQLKNIESLTSSDSPVTTIEKHLAGIRAPKLQSEGRQTILGKHDQPAVCKMGRIQVPIKEQRKVSGCV
jgi:hypothetical protein